MVAMPACWSVVTTAPQVDPSAHVPWTSTTVGVELSADIIFLSSMVVCCMRSGERFDRWLTPQIMFQGWLQ